jgi:GAF domain-containing protein
MSVDAAAFLVVDQRRTTVRSTADWFASSLLRRALAPTLNRPYDRSLPGLTEAAIERGRPLFLPRLEDWEAAPQLRVQAEGLLGKQGADRAWELYRQSSVISCPVKTTLGQTLGVLVVASVNPARPLRRVHLQIVEVLSDLAALALERSDLLETEAIRAREELLLKRAAEAVAGSLDSDEVYGLIVEHALRATGGTKGLIATVQPGSHELAVSASEGYSAAAKERRFTLEGSMLAEVARSRTPYLSNPADADQWDSRLLEEEGVRSFMHVPIALGPRFFGVISVAHENTRFFGQKDLDLLVKIARLSGAGIANAIDFERERRIAHALTRGFVPAAVPELPGYEVGLAYEPADNQPTGGDLYGAWPLFGGDVAVLVGDVAGKGVETAALSAMARFFIEARSWDSTSPAEVLTQANTMLRTRLPDYTFVTAFLGVISPDRIRYCNAGHPPPLVVPAEGNGSELVGHGLPLGVDPNPGYEDLELQLRPGDLLLGYTDGLVEARREGELFGAERLLELVAGMGHERSLDEIASAVHEGVRRWADGLGDDSVALAVRRREP